MLGNCNKGTGNTDSVLIVGTTILVYGCYSYYELQDFEKVLFIDVYTCVASV
jgi:hypothetical protein